MAPRKNSKVAAPKKRPTKAPLNVIVNGLVKPSKISNTQPKVMVLRKRKISATDDKENGNVVKRRKISPRTAPQNVKDHLTKGAAKASAKDKPSKGSIKKVAAKVKKAKIDKSLKVDATKKGRKSKKIVSQAKRQRGVVAVAKKSTPAKKAKKATKETTVVTPAKKRTSKKALVPRDFITEYKVEPTFETREKIPHVSTIAHSRLLIRAIQLNDTKMLKTLVNDKKSICSLTIPRSLNVHRDALSYAIEKQNVEAMKILFDAKLSKDLAPFPDIIIGDESTGSNSTMMFGHALRTVTVGRGGKEGNNALLKDKDTYMNRYSQTPSITTDVAREIMSFGPPKSFIDKLGQTLPAEHHFHSSLFHNAVIYAIRAGHNQLAGQLIEEATAKGGYGFSALHKEVLLFTSEKLYPFKSVSVIKKAIYNDRITPLHCAAINPNPSYLNALINSRPADYSSTLDTQNWSVIHYASVCTGTGPLELLLSRGISTDQVNKNGDTPLHLASALGRIDNVKLILAKEKEKDGEEDGVEDDDDVPKKVVSVSLVHRINKIGQTPLHVAAASGHSNVVAVLLAAGADPNKFTPARHDKLTAFMLAARNGHVNVLKTFVEHGYLKVDAVDHKGRTALAHATINGQAHVVSHLLRIGANNLKTDTSGNTLVHYAAAYGWYFCLKLLLESGCPPNQPNDWKMTPLTIGFMKGHIGLVEYLLQQPNVDIDSRVNDNTGFTLLLQAVCCRDVTEEYIKRIKFLLVDQKANCNTIDFEGNNAFHYIVVTEYKAMSKDSKYKGSKTQKIIFEATKLLWDHNCDPNVKNSSKETAISLAVQYGCFPALNHLYDLTSILPTEPNDERNNILHLMANQAHDKKMMKFCGRLVVDPVKKEALRNMAVEYNKHGQTPLLLLLAKVTSVRSSQVNNVVEFIKFLVHTLSADVAAVDRKEKSGESVLHLACSVSYAVEALNVILPMRPPLEVVNFQRQTPLTYAIVKGYESAAAVLLQNGADVNVKMPKMNSLMLLHTVSQKSSFHLVPLMMDVGADIHQVNPFTKNSTLHYVCRKPHLPFALETVRKLVEQKCNVDAVNKDGRTALHLAVNFRAGETDASYEIEDLLIESKCKLNIRDHRGRIPLHMAFVKIGKHTDTSFMDPIELVTTLVRAMKQSVPNFSDEIRLPDEFGMTPLHYAAARGATISCSYLLSEMNGQIDSIDRNGNTPFGLAVLHGHEGCALQFQQKGANFIANLNTNLTQSIGASESDCHDVAEGMAWEWLVDRKRREHRTQTKMEKENYPILQEIVAKDWQGILHLILEQLKSSGIGAAFPIAAAISTNRLKLVRKLAGRAPSTELLHVNGDGETLLHVFSKTALEDGTTNRTLSEEIVNVFASKGIAYGSLDKDDATPLIRAASNRNAVLCSLLSQPNVTKQNQYTSLAYTDRLGRNPFAALFWNLNSKTAFSAELRNWAESILEQGTNANALCQYPIVFPVHFSGVRFLPGDKDASSASKYTPLMMAVIAGNYPIVEWLLTMRNSALIDVNCQDDDGKTALMHAVQLNDAKMVRLLINPTEKEQSNGVVKNECGHRFNVVDRNGWTVVEHAVAATIDGTYYYANGDAILRILFSGGAKLAEKSGDGFTPLQRAVTMKRFHLVKCIEELLKVPQSRRTPEHEQINRLEPIGTNLSTAEHTSITDYERDCQMEMENVMEMEEDSDEDSDDDGIEADDVMNEAVRQHFKVVFDADNQIHFNCCLTKVDISYGVHGLYNFYKMQLVKQDGGTELIVLLTRWGRVGDEGQYQKTPFPTVEQAVEEFKKIFRSKTGNQWDNLPEFTPLPKKYRLVEQEIKRVKRPSQVEIDFDKFQSTKNKLKPTTLPMPLVRLMENLVMAHKENVKFDYCGFEEDFQNKMLSRFTSATLRKAADILESIEKLIQQRDKQRMQNQSNPTIEMEFMESVLKPSEEFYCLIPVYGFQCEKLKPLFSMDDLREKQKVIHRLIHLEFASKLFFAAQYNLNVVNPFEYVFRCLDTKLEVLAEEGEEAQLILQYIRNTSTLPSEWNSYSTPPKVSRIFRVERSGEMERINACGVGNRHLLWHGTSSVNVLSILHRGLKVAPLEADLSGALFGKGIYFADMFMKSQKYSHGSNPKFMFLCEVALGTVHPIKLNSFYQTSESKVLPDNCHSLKTSDSRWQPDPSSTIIYKGRTIPLGAGVENILPEFEYHSLDHNEYVIYREDQVQLRYLVQYNE